MEEIEVGADPEFLQGAGDAGGAQVQGALLDVLPGRQDLIGGKLAGDHPAVAGLLLEPADIRLPPGGVLPLAGNVGVQGQDQLAGGVAELAVGLAGSRPRQDRVGLGGVGGGQVAGLLLDDPQVDRVDQAGAQRGEGLGEPLGDLGGVVHLPGGALLAHVQLAGQLVGGELALDAGPGPAGVLPDRGHQRPRVPGLLTPHRRDDPQQLIIRAARQPRALRPRHRVHHRGQQRARGHRVGRAALAETGQGQLPGGEGDVQALLRARGVLVRRDSRQAPGRGRGPGSGNRSWDMHHAPFGRNKEEAVRTV